MREQLFSIPRRRRGKASGGYGEEAVFIGNQMLRSAADQEAGVLEAQVSAPAARGLFSDALGSAVDRRAYFFLFRQEKVAKKKATPAYAVGCADCLALLEGPGGCGTRGCAPQTVLADCPRPFSAAQRFRWGPGTASQFAGSTSDLSVSQLTCLSLSESDALPSPSASSSSTGGAGEVGLHCLSRRRVHASRPPRRAAQSTRRSRATKRARFLFGDFFLAKQEKVTRRSTAKPSRNYGEPPFLPIEDNMLEKLTFKTNSPWPEWRLHAISVANKTCDRLVKLTYLPRHADCRLGRITPLHLACWSARLSG